MPQNPKSLINKMKKICETYQKHLDKEEAKILQKVKKELLNSAVSADIIAPPPVDVKASPKKAINIRAMIRAIPITSADETIGRFCTALGMTETNFKNEFLAPYSRNEFLTEINGKREVMEKALKALDDKDDKKADIDKVMKKFDKGGEYREKLAVRRTHENRNFSSKFWQKIDSILKSFGVKKSTLGVTGASVSKNLYTKFSSYTRAREAEYRKGKKPLPQLPRAKK